MNQGKMKAVICGAYGNADVLNVLEVNKPVCKENEVLIEIKNASVNTADAMMRKGEPKYARLFLGCSKPKNPIIGTGFSGIIVEKGKLVSNFKIGDKVFGETGIKFSANAEFVAMPSYGVILQKPKELDFDDASVMCDGVLTSYNFLVNIAKLKASDKILVIGASGSLGVAAVQLAHHMNAEVTGVCSTKNVDLVYSLGADKVIDYNKDDYSQLDKEYDIIYDAIGVSSFSKCKNVLTPNGLYMSPVLNFKLLFRMILNPLLGKKKAFFQATGLQKEVELKKMLNNLIPIIIKDKYDFVLSKRFGMNQISEAHRLIDTSRKVGNFVLDIKD